MSGRTREAAGRRKSHPEIAGGLLLASGLAWWWTVKRMAGMDAGPGTDLGPLGWFAGSWALMMAAMMLPSLAPALVAYATRQQARLPTPAAIRTRWLLFVAGYLLVWTAAGLCAYGLFSLGKDLLGSGLAWPRGGRWLAAGTLVAAAGYEFIPVKRAALARCRGQLAGSDGRARRRQLAARLRPGRAAAFATGVRSGGWCLGCSWALMAALFALGVMSLTWMALIAGLVALEKAGPWPRAARIATAAVLAVLAIGLVAAPHEVPGLVVPGSGGMHAAMRMTG